MIINNNGIRLEKTESGWKALDFNVQASTCVKTLVAKCLAIQTQGLGRRNTLAALTRREIAKTNRAKLDVKRRRIQRDVKEVTV